MSELGRASTTANPAYADLTCRPSGERTLDRELLPRLLLTHRLSSSQPQVPPPSQSSHRAPTPASHTLHTSHAPHAAHAPHASNASHASHASVASSGPLRAEPSAAHEAEHQPVVHTQRLDESQIREFARVLLDEDAALAPAYTAELRASGVPVESIYLDLMAPTARVLGAMWEDDTCTFVDVTIALGRLQSLLRDMSHVFVRDRPETDLVGRALLASIPGEQHSLGLFMVADFFIRDGWGVHVGAPLTAGDLLATVGAEWFDVVGFSVACDSRLGHLKREILRVRAASKNANVLVMVGGRAFNEQPELLRRVGADASAINAELAPERARQLLSL